LSGEGSEHSSTKVCACSGVDLPVIVISQSQKQKLDHIKVEPLSKKSSDREIILAKLSPQAILPGSETDRISVSSQVISVTKSVPASDLMEITQPYTQGDKVGELFRLKQELLAANSKIALQEQELAQSRVMRHTMDQALGPPSEADFGSREITEQTISHLQNAFKTSNSAFGQFQDAWGGNDESRSESSDLISAGAYNRSRGLWVHHEPSMDREYGESLSTASSSASQDPNRYWAVSGVYQPFAGPQSLQPQKVLSGPSPSPCGFYPRPTTEQMRYTPGPSHGGRRSITQNNRGGSLIPIQSNPWNEFGSGTFNEQTIKPPPSPTKRPPSAFQQAGLYTVPSYMPRPIGSPLSPTATEFMGSGTNESSWGTSSVRVTTLNVSLGTRLTYIFFYSDKWQLCPNICVPTRATELPTSARQECIV
jgi:hypothetical protein